MREIESSIQEQLPDVTPEKRKTVTETYEIVYFGAQKGSAKTVYELRQSPILDIEDVRATVNGSEQSLPDSAYESRAVNSDQPDSVAFVEPELYPDVDTTFEIRYQIQPVIERYVDAYDDDIESVSAKLDDIKGSHYIRSADETELQRLGQLFGELGRQRSRSVPSYRQYLRSIVPSFDARGTKSGMKFVLSSALQNDTDDIEIRENFDTESFNIELNNWPSHQTTTIVQLADIAAPSGVERVPPIYYNLDGVSIAYVSFDTVVPDIKTVTEPIDFNATAQESFEETVDTTGLTTGLALSTDDENVEFETIAGGIDFDPAAQESLQETVDDTGLASGVSLSTADEPSGTGFALSSGDGKFVFETVAERIVFDLAAQDSLQQTVNATALTAGLALSTADETVVFERISESQTVINPQPVSTVTETSGLSTVQQDTLSNGFTLS